VSRERESERVSSDKYGKFCAEFAPKKEMRALTKGLTKGGRRKREEERALVSLPSFDIYSFLSQCVGVCRLIRFHTYKV
jgi:hypothetical protein